MVPLSLGSLALLQSADEREPGGGDLRDVPLGLVEVGHGGVQAAPGNLVGVVHLQSRRGAMPVLGWEREVIYGNALSRNEKVRQTHKE